MISTTDTKHKGHDVGAAPFNPRKRGADDVPSEVNQNAKKLNLGKSADDGPIVLEDDKDTTIVIDDD